MLLNKHYKIVFKDGYINKTFVLFYCSLPFHDHLNFDSAYNETVNIVICNSILSLFSNNDIKINNASYIYIF